MADLFWLTTAQIRRIVPYVPLSHGVPQVDDQRVVSGTLHVIRSGLRWPDALAEYGSHKTLYNRSVRWSCLGVFNRIFASLAARAGEPERLIIDATHLKVLLLTEGQMSDHKGAALMLPRPPRAKEPLGDKVHESNRFRAALVERGIAPCIPSSNSRKVPLPYGRALYRQRHRIKNMFGRPKDWRRVAVRYDRCAHTFMSAIRLTDTMFFWFNES